MYLAKNLRRDISKARESREIGRIGRKVTKTATFHQTATYINYFCYEKRLIVKIAQKLLKIVTTIVKLLKFQR